MTHLQTTYEPLGSLHERSHTAGQLGDRIANRDEGVLNGWIGAGYEAMRRDHVAMFIDRGGSNR